LWTEDKFEEFAEKRAEQILTKLTKYTAWKNNEGITSYLQKRGFRTSMKV
jgi:SOS response regulatory protein OraA/RecX